MFVVRRTADHRRVLVAGSERHETGELNKRQKVRKIGERARLGLAMTATLKHTPDRDPFP
jgi:hypothetical protein